MRILEVCADLVRAAVVNNDGNILVFLPGMEDILRVRSILVQKKVRGDPKMKIIRLHSDILGYGEDGQELADSEEHEGARLVFLSSLVVARGVYLGDIKYVFIHPLCRTTLLHQSGVDIWGEELRLYQLLAQYVEA